MDCRSVGLWSAGLPAGETQQEGAEARHPPLHGELAGGRASTAPRGSLSVSPTPPGAGTRCAPPLGPCTGGEIEAQLSREPAGGGGTGVCDQTAWTPALGGHPGRPPAEPAPPAGAWLHPPALGSESERPPALPQARPAREGPAPWGGGRSAGWGPALLLVWVSPCPPALRGPGAAWLVSDSVSASRVCLSVCLSKATALEAGGAGNGVGEVRRPQGWEVSRGSGRPWRDRPSCSPTSRPPALSWAGPHPGWSVLPPQRGPSRPPSSTPPWPPRSPSTARGTPCWSMPRCTGWAL